MLLRWPAAAASVLALAGSVACGSVTGPSRSAALGQPFDLRVGETVGIEDQLLALTFDAVTSDSRCPMGVLCIRAGDATLALTAVRLPDHRQSLGLGTGDWQPEAATVQDFTVRLVQLSPPRRLDAAPAPSDYVATLVVSR